ncbi:MAG: DUF1194 domain-containing protein [Rhizobiaceae bacterium]
MSLPAHAWWGILGSVATALGFFPVPQAYAAEPVDVELVLAVDVSLSMSPMELEIQRKGYAAALTDKQVLDAIASGGYGKVAITYFEWAGSTSQHVIVPWTVIASPQDAERVAEQLTAAPSNSARRTSISSAIDFGVDLFAETNFRGMKRVIDVSGDGPNNQGPAVNNSRDAAVAQGIIINGLPLMTNGGFTSAYDVTDLDLYYTDCVIGGPGSFMIPVNDWEQFPEAVRRKLVLELAGADHLRRIAADAGPLPVIYAQARPQYDCLVGEKMWRDRSWMWDAR